MDTKHTTNRKIWKSVRIAAILLILAPVIYVFTNNYLYSSGFETIKEGMSKAEVIAIMGTPSAEDLACSEPPMWLDKPLSNVNCAHEIEYSASLTPEYWTIGFDAHGHVVTKYHYVSP